MQKTSQFKTQCKGDISRAFKTAKITVFDTMMCKRPDVPLQAELLALTIHLRTSQTSILQCCMDGDINSSWVHITYTKNDQHSSSPVPTHPRKVVFIPIASRLVQRSITDRTMDSAAMKNYSAAGLVF